MRLCLSFFILLITGAAAGLSAQEGPDIMLPPEPEVKATTNESPLKSLKLKAYLMNKFYKMGNGDLMNTDGSSYATVEDTDDEFFLGFSEIGVSAEVQVLDYIFIEAEISRPGYWGNDSLTTGSPYNAFYVWTLYSKFDIAQAVFNTKAMALDFIIGRQPVAIVESEVHNNYVLDDTLDAFLLNFEMKDMGIGAALFLDFFSLNSPNGDIYTLKSPRHDYTVPYFNGDVNIFKAGLVPYWKMTGSAADAVKTLAVSPYFLFSRVGATGDGTYNMGGYERSRIGTEGNFADNDWLMIAGADILFEMDGVSLFFEGAYSFGIDRKSTDKPNVDISGVMLHFSGEADILEWLNFGAEFVYSSGATTDKYGNYLNYGFVSMKGDKVGGYIFRNYYGIYPSAYVNYSGIDFNPIEAKHKAPIMAASAKLGIENLDLSGVAPGKQGLNASIEGWFYMDTSATSMDTNIILPANIYDELRLGRMMGIEIDLAVSYVFSQGVFEVGLEGGMFIPGPFYAYYASLEEAPYGNQPAYGVDLFTSLEF
ncbi:MAG: hypothetical protein A2Y33_15905 [Spirochaetes bacterium GWF1_51_8]|nr:MAG: hypothetical protein A2Y33_15905 [Spirochaetes bacterium GWF1_51_8]